MLCHQGGEDDEVCPWPTTWKVPPKSVGEHLRALSLNSHWEQQSMEGHTCTKDRDKFQMSEGLWKCFVSLPRWPQAPWRPLTAKSCYHPLWTTTGYQPKQLHSRNPNQSSCNLVLVSKPIRCWRTGECWWVQSHFWTPTRGVQEIPRGRCTLPLCFCSKRGVRDTGLSPGHISDKSWGLCGFNFRSVSHTCPFNKHPG